MDVLFIAFIGEYVQKVQPHSYDAEFQRAFPFIYHNLDVIGFRTLQDPFAPDSSAELSKMIMYKFISYIVYLLSSIYLHNQFVEKQNLRNWESSAKEIDFYRLFEFG